PRLFRSYADCVPVYIYSRINSFTALVDAGWKGTSKEILTSTLNEYDGEAKDLTVLIGISINASHYEVDDKVIDALGDRYLEDAVVETDSGNHVDLNAVIRYQGCDCDDSTGNRHVTLYVMMMAGNNM